ncbi:MAG: ParB/RepB/Spo0J family partition protein, partial [Candidatus Eisenbacteria bacterium]|nr:ParB/RepB/Spo0J family partition protein [Candidatus Eisenbacteria bacterium]
GSIASHGVLQPVVVRPVPTGGYQLIVGERRLRAARLAGLERIPAIVREAGEAETLELALVENLQREDLNPIDEAHGYEALMEVAGLNQSQLAEHVGRDRSTVANALRLLELPLDVQELLSAGSLTAGHGRTLLGAKSAEERSRLAKKVVDRGLSVRQLESLVRGKQHRKKASRPRRTDDPVVREMEERLQRIFGTQVRIDRMGGEGTVRIEYYSEEDLTRVVDLLLTVKEPASPTDPE